MQSAVTAEPEASSGHSKVRAVHWAGPTGLFVLSFVLYAVLAHRSPLPIIVPDEFRYAHLVRSLADGTGLIWRDDHVPQSATLYLHALAPLWSSAQSTVTAYHWSKTFNALALSLQVFPLYALAYPILGRRLALVAAAFSLGGVWMVASAHIITENLALPLSTTGLCFAAMTLYRPSNKTGFLALGFVVLAVFARIQLAVLLPALAVAFTLDVFLQPRGEERQERLDAHLLYLAAATLISLIGGIVALFAPHVTGDYSNLFGLHPSVGRAALKTALELGDLTAMSGFLPVLLLAAVSVRPHVWRDRTIAPLLCVFWPVALITAAQAGLFLAGVSSQRPLWWGIERYVAYALPIGFVALCAVAKKPRLIDRTALIVAGVLGMLFALHAHGVAISEERASWATSFRVKQLVGGPTGIALALAAVTGVGIVAATRRFATARSVGVSVFVVTGALLFAQDQASWHYLTNVTATFRHSLPSDLEWVDHSAGRPVALIGLTRIDPTFNDLELFNRNLEAVYIPRNGIRSFPAGGKVCHWTLGKAGEIQFEDGCGKPPETLLVNDPSASATFQREARSWTEPHIGRIAAVGPGPVRFRSIVGLPCPRAVPRFSLTTTKTTPATASFPCLPALSVDLWLPSANTLVVQYRGGHTPQSVTVGARRWSVPPNQTTTVRIPVPSGPSTTQFDDTWTRSGGTPRIIGVRLAHGPRPSLL